MSKIPGTTALGRFIINGRSAQAIADEAAKGLGRSPREKGTKRLAKAIEEDWDKAANLLAKVLAIIDATNDELDHPLSGADVVAELCEIRDGIARVFNRE